jgi:hypothetical protein
MTTGGGDRARRLLDDLAWGTRTGGSRSSQWAAYVEFCKQERRALVPVTESQLFAYVGWLATEREAGRPSISAKSLPQYLSAVRVVSRAIFTPDMPSEDRPMSMPILQAFIRAYAQWEAQSFAQLTHRGGVPADVIQAVWVNGMQSALPDVIREAAAVVTAYVLGLRELSVMSLPTENVTITEDRMILRLVLVKGRPLRHATPATYVRTGTAGLPSSIDLVQRWMACRNDHPLLFGGTGDAPEWRPGNLSAALARALEAVSRAPLPVTIWTSHSLRIGSHAEQTLLGFPIGVRKARFGWGPDSDDMTSLYFDRQTCLSPASCWVFGPSMAGRSPPGPSR